ncbi:MAG: diguanylate cyclase [Saccharofermentans sp.]|nr:diguanylate cyclase [Saccharofermentans sp.]
MLMCSEPSDSEKYLARLGGDEFFLVISGYKTDDELKNTLSSYIDALGGNLTVDGYELYVSASFGYAEFPTDASTADTLISVTCTDFLRTSLR